MKHKVSELEGYRLDQAVALAEGYRPDEEDRSAWWSPTCNYIAIAPDSMRDGVRMGFGYRPSRAWEHGGPIIERERIDLDQAGEGGGVTAAIHENLGDDNFSVIAACDGPTPLIAAMRVYVASRFGEEIELP